MACFLHSSRRLAGVHVWDCVSNHHGSVMSIDIEFAWARGTDPRTSHEAAASIRLSELQDTVLQALKIIPGGATSLELADALCMSPWSVSPRIKPLVKKGLVRDSGRTRMGVSGRASIVWEAV